MTYKGYEAQIAFDYDREVFYGKILHIEDLVTFEAKSVDELKNEFEQSVEDYLEWCEEEGKDPDRPYSGNFVVRGTSEIHKAVVTISSRTGESMNSVVIRAIQQLVDEELHGKIRQPQVHVTEQWVHIGAVQLLPAAAESAVPMFGDAGFGSVLAGEYLDAGRFVLAERTGQSASEDGAADGMTKDGGMYA